MLQNHASMLGNLLYTMSYDRTKLSGFNRRLQPHVLGASSASHQRQFCFDGSHSRSSSILVSGSLSVSRQKEAVLVAYLVLRFS